MAGNAVVWCWCLTACGWPFVRLSKFMSVLCWIWCWKLLGFYVRLVLLHVIIYKIKLQFFCSFVFLFEEDDFKKKKKKMFFRFSECDIDYFMNGVFGCKLEYVNIQEWNLQNLYKYFINCFINFIFPTEFMKI